MIPALIAPFMGWVRYLPYFVGAAMIAYGGWKLYSFGHDRGEKKAKQELAEYKKTIRNERELEKIAYDEALAEKARVEESYDQLRWKHEQIVQAKLAADLRASELAVRLRLAATRATSLPEPAGTAPEHPGASGTGGGGSALALDSAVSGVIEACRRDSIKLVGWQSWYEEVSK